MSLDLAVATYWWGEASPTRYNGRHSYSADDVRLLQRQVARHLDIRHRFICVTDRPEVFAEDDDIKVVPIDWTKHVPGTCFVRLMTFHPDGRDMFDADRVLQLDLDTVIVGSLDAIVDRSEDLVLWRNPKRWSLEFPWLAAARKLSWFNSSVLLHRTGTLPKVWQSFDPQAAGVPAVRDDQWWISDMAGQYCPYWDDSHGIYRLAPEGRPHLGIRGELPDNARIVTFPGDSGKPWLPETIAENPWITQHRNEHS